jgi:hypothetical protein
MGMKRAVLGGKQLVVNVMQLDAAEAEIAGCAAKILPGAITPAFGRK